MQRRALYPESMQAWAMGEASERTRSCRCLLGRFCAVRPSRGRVPKLGAGGKTRRGSVSCGEVVSCDVPVSQAGQQQPPPCRNILPPHSLCYFACIIASPGSFLARTGCVFERTAEHCLVPLLLLLLVNTNKCDFTRFAWQNDMYTCHLM